MKDFSRKYQVNKQAADVTGERRRDEMESRFLEAQLEEAIKEWAYTSMKNIREEIKKVQKIVDLYEKIKMMGEDYDIKDYEEQKKRLNTLKTKEMENRFRESEEDESCREYREEEQGREKFEREGFEIE